MITIITTINETDDGMDVKSEGQGEATPREVFVCQKIRDAINKALEGIVQQGEQHIRQTTDPINPLN